MPLMMPWIEDIDMVETKEDEATKKLAKKLAKQLLDEMDKRIKDIISSKLGMSNWAYAEVNDRCELFLRRSGIGELFFDDELLLTIYPPEFKIVGGKMSATQAIVYYKESPMG